MPGLGHDGDVHVLDLGPAENRIDPDWIARVSAALDEVEAAPAPRALVTTGSGKFFSLGLDLEWMAANPDGAGELVASLHAVCARMLELPLPTVAALPGHTFAGGALFALAHDYRVMREDRGWFCLPEIDGAIAITPGLIDLVRTRLAPQTAHEALTAGRRYSAAEAARERIVDAVAPLDEVVPKAAEIARGLSGKDPATYGAMKARLYRDALASLRDADANAADVRMFRAAMAAMGIAG
ncbi:MAG TPA: enoyl-CoA hydratase-related protein [Thermoleophilaceae bacterium]|jgi:enoyl-CoA hydratase/carnithine racemase